MERLLHYTVKEARLCTLLPVPKRKAFPGIGKRKALLREKDQTVH
jgi:hypothetical protein